MTMSTSGYARDTKDRDAGTINSRLHALITSAIAAAVFYAVLGASSRGFCPGGFTSDGGFLDAAGNPTDVAPVCVNVTTHASFWVFVVVAAIVVAAAVLVRRRAKSLDQAKRILGIALIAVVAVVFLCLIVNYLSVFASPKEDWMPGAALPLHIPGSLDVEFSLLNG